MVLDSDKCPGEKIKWGKGMKSWRWNIDVWGKIFTGRGINKYKGSEMGGGAWFVCGTDSKMGVTVVLIGKDLSFYSE